MKSAKLRIIFTCDTHGCFFPFDMTNGKKATGSLSRVATYVWNLRKTYGENLLLLDGGDILQGQPTCYFSNFVTPETTNLAAAVMNLMQYDCMTIGNHDIETGHDVYDKFCTELNCSVLAANLLKKNSPATYFKPYTIIHRQGIKIAVVGITTQAVPYWLCEQLWHGLEFADAVSATKHILEEIRIKEQPDITIGLFHTGLDGGLQAGGYTENATRKIVASTDSLDLVLFGHDHKSFSGYLKNSKGENVPCLNPSSNSCLVGDAEVELYMDETAGNRRIKISGKLVAMDNIEPDAEFCRRFNGEYKAAKGFLDRKIGVANERLQTRDAWFGSAPFTDFIHRIQLEVSGADISFTAPLVYDENIEAGPIRIRDIFNLYKYENQIVALRMTGYEIRRYLEMSYGLWINTMTTPADHIMNMAYYEYKGKETAFFRNLAFNFDTAAGINYTVDATKPRGHRINILSMSNGTPFTDDGWYTVAMHSYRGNGGTELLTKGAGIPFDEIPQRTVFRSKSNQRSYIIRDIEKNYGIFLNKATNWKFIPEDWASPAILRDRMELFGDNF